MPETILLDFPNPSGEGRSFIYLPKQDGALPQNAILQSRSLRVDKRLSPEHNWPLVVESVMNDSSFIIVDSSSHSTALADEVGIIDKLHLQYKVIVLRRDVMDEACLRTIARWQELGRVVPVLNTSQLAQIFRYLTPLPTAQLEYGRQDNTHLLERFRVVDRFLSSRDARLVRQDIADPPASGDETANPSQPGIQTTHSWSFTCDVCGKYYTNLYFQDYADGTIPGQISCPSCGEPVRDMVVMQSYKVSPVVLATAALLGFLLLGGTIAALYYQIHAML